jgi:ubiquinone/menaquinone biosynthesis C-methylase UbiE
MGLLLKIAKRIAGKESNPIIETEPEAGYDLWAGTYDLQPDNLMLALDNIEFKRMSSHVNFANKVVADIGCGTGRHWGEILDQKPFRLIGYDVSVGMLNVLKKKFPHAETYQSNETNKLEHLDTSECDIIISTLALAHFQNPEGAFVEWNRILKPGGAILITDYHPAALAMGGDRTFTFQSKTISIKNYVHSIENLREMFKENQFEIMDFDEKLIDESVRHYYEKQNAIHVFERFKNVPIIYGMYLKKSS